MIRCSVSCRLSNLFETLEQQYPMISHIWLLIRKIAYPRSSKRVCVKKMFLPVQDETAREMAANLKSCHSWYDLRYFLMKECNLFFCWGIFQPLSVFRGRVHRTTKCNQPFIHRAVVMWMRNDDAIKSTNGIDLCSIRIIVGKIWSFSKKKK